MKFQQHMNAIMHDLKMQIGQLANSVSQIHSNRSRNLPSQTIPNPKGWNMSVVTLKSNKELQVMPRPNPNPTNTESKTKADSRAKTTLLPFPSRSLLARKPKTDDDFLQMSPKYAKFLKDLCIHKRKKLKVRAEVGGVLSTFIQKEVTTRTQPTLSGKCRDPGIFSIPCTIGDCTFVDAMLDLGASINVMPASVYKSLNFEDLEPTGIVIQLANRSVVQPVGILKDVLVQVNELIFPTDFYVLNMEDETYGKRSTLILGRPFLMTARTKIDVYAGTLSMEFRNNEASPKDHSLYSIDMIEELVEEFTQLDFGSSITKEADFTNKTEVLDPFDFGNHVCRHNEEPDCSISARIQVVERLTLSQMATTNAESDLASEGRKLTKAKTTSPHQAPNPYQAGKERKLQLQELEELHLKAYENCRIYKQKVKQFHDNQILRKEFKVDQKVLLFNSGLKLIPGKLHSRWDSPFVIANIFPYGAIEL
ncbi:hypothetical protein CR513_46467, partial [Mucuna pruriens]